MSPEWEDLPPFGAHNPLFHAGGILGYSLELAISVGGESVVIFVSDWGESICFVPGNTIDKGIELGRFGLVWEGWVKMIVRKLLIPSTGFDCVQY